MIGIRAVASYLPQNRINNLDRQKVFEFEDEFLEKKIGFLSISRKNADEDTSDMCCAAFDQLVRNGGVDPDSVQVVAVCTQNPDYSIPHTAAIVHGKLGLTESCAAFDISLGCSGYTYGLAIIKNFMRGMGFTSGLLFTSDPYSKIIDETNRDTALLFGDAATVTHIGTDPIFALGRFTFGTRGKEYSALICRNGILNMNGRTIFDFSASTIPDDIKEALKLNNLKIDEIHYFLIHQGSKYIVDFIKKRLRLPDEKTPFKAQGYGNTVSSSIPLLLEDVLTDQSAKRVLITGFGVGLSWSTTVLFRQR
ncbi:MAG: ketoacyl-ACP synthase III [Desulfobacteraceae bacterium]|nr:ketoacyl-ACP synthase III [Desulfobacteraceae bacterium]MBC2718111.1 ketoacyl-ACP synthase III [Desulfobacteraceae bacterium]